MVPACDRQDERFSSAFKIVSEAIARRVFPAASIAVTHSGKLVALKPFGKFVYEEDLKGAPLFHDVGRSGSSEVTASTPFDLASLTKPIATTTMAMILHDRSRLELDTPLIGTMPEFLIDSCGEADPRRHAVTFRMLLAHSSGLPAYEKLFLKARTRDELLFAALTTPLSATPGTHAEYSDIGFIVLAAALERIAEESLDVFCQREIFGPLALSDTTFNPPAEIRAKIPPTADEREEAKCGADTPVRELPPPEKQPSVSVCSTFRNRIIQGEVQDENASVSGGVAGHAGLFSTAEDVASFAHAILQGRTPFHPGTTSLFTRRDSTPGTSRALGWDTPSSPSQSGQYFGPNSFGHLGYTGTSLWIDPDRKLSITLLTNRTWPDCANQEIKQIRPRFHDAIVEALG